MATSKRNDALFTQKGYRREKEKPTDGVVKYIYRDIEAEDSYELLKNCRTILLTKK